jgi:membrane-associated two-gene conflict system component 1 (EACC1)
VVSLIVWTDGSPDDVRSLREWLSDEDELRGRVRLVEQAPRPGELGSVVDSLAIVLGSGGAGTVLAQALVAWLRSRTSDLTVSLRGSDGAALTVDAKRIRGLAGDDLVAAVDAIAAGLPRDRSSQRDAGSAGD